MTYDRSSRKGVSFPSRQNPYTSDRKRKGRSRKTDGLLGGLRVPPRPRVFRPTRVRQETGTGRERGPPSTLDAPPHTHGLVQLGSAQGSTGPRKTPTFESGTDYCFRSSKLTHSRSDFLKFFMNLPLHGPRTVVGHCTAHPHFGPSAVDPPLSTTRLSPRPSFPTPLASPSRTFLVVIDPHSQDHTYPQPNFLPPPRLRPH